MRSASRQRVARTTAFEVRGALPRVARTCRRFLPGCTDPSPTRCNHDLKAADLKTGGPRYRLL
jgi:hypothetical protein